MYPANEAEAWVSKGGLVPVRASRRAGKMDGVGRTDGRRSVAGGGDEDNGALLLLPAADESDEGVRIRRRRGETVGC